MCMETRQGVSKALRLTPTATGPVKRARSLGGRLARAPLDARQPQPPIHVSLHTHCLPGSLCSEHAAPRTPFSPETELARPLPVHPLQGKLVLGDSGKTNKQTIRQLETKPRLSQCYENSDESDHRLTLLA